MTKLVNDTDAIIKGLIRKNQELEAKLEKSYWRIKNQKAEIRRLNNANIKKIHLLTLREDEISELKQK